ncbi:dihydrofolate reductase family protein [Herbiconiux sp. CPCC 203407]|uniref:Dihydrofolate reductase family protein n=1 Tax=Herbiconiux oxytropis TaxID=2970915 RepID=A0AA41XHR3_9MICO|nr:dihydrofolate reductase family protein [Herbiconiux oxytropis]MCS5720467.1 dihydrofolate reductase family protein [Herbiconiux oxytropis]MCS5726040.1 dihydrofolate reductase family protein [Herbiconiux oxytropis]
MTTTTQYYVASSVDGFIADREGKLDWLMQFGFEEFTAGYEAFLAEVAVVVMGAETYEFVRAEGHAWAYPEQTAWVLTRRDLPRMEGGHIRFAQGDVRDLHAEWVEAAAGRNIWIVGGGQVAAQVADAGLLDEIVLTTMPVVLGAGTPLLPVGTATGALEVSGTEVLPSGAIASRYRITR